MGADDALGHQLAEALVDGDVHTAVLRTHERQTPEALTLRLNALDRSARGRDGVLPEALRAQYREIEAWREVVLAEQGPPTG